MRINRRRSRSRSRLGRRRSPTQDTVHRAHCDGGSRRRCTAVGPPARAAARGRSPALSVGTAASRVLKVRAERGPRCLRPGRRGGVEVPSRNLRTTAAFLRGTLPRAQLPGKSRRALPPWERAASSTRSRSNTTAFSRPQNRVTKEDAFLTFLKIQDHILCGRTRGVTH